MGNRPRKKPARRQTNAAASAVDDASADDAFDAEFQRQGEELDRSSRVMTRVLFFVFLAVAILMLVIAVLTGVSTSRKLAREQSALGQVTALTERKDSNGNSYFYPVVSFETPGDGRRNIQLAEGTWPPQQRVGDLVTVLYDPQNPLDARVQSRDGNFGLWIWTLVTGVLAVAFLGATALAWALGRSSGSNPE